MPRDGLGEGAGPIGRITSILRSQPQPDSSPALAHKKSGSTNREMSVLPRNKRRLLRRRRQKVSRAPTCSARGPPELNVEACPTRAVGCPKAVEVSDRLP